MIYTYNIYMWLQHNPEKSVIHTRDLLHLGTRSAVDKCLSRLAIKGVLTRVALGVYVRSGDTAPSGKDLAVEKVSGFMHQIADHADILVQDYGFDNSAESSNEVFSIGSGSSSFIDVINSTRIYTKTTCPRKRAMDSTPEGRSLRILWQLGKRKFKKLSDREIRAMPGLNRHSIARYARVIPYWMTNRLLHFKWD